MDFLKQLYPAAMMTLSLILVTGVAYPLGVTVLANVFFKEKAQGSLIVKNGEVVGSKLIGQPFTGDAYFHSRPSAAGNVGYDGTASGGTNLGPTSKKLIEEKVASVADAIRAENPSAPIPVDLVTSSASGLDPHITPAAAAFQLVRISKVRGIKEDALRELVSRHTEARTFGLLGEPRVNVLELNLDLDATFPMRSERTLP
jgi:potassium-transporting ATPase KdpC subunit